MKDRQPVELLAARPASDGAGVKLLRVFGGARLERFDPFLMLDEFGSNEASDYIGGFPPHPHRGFETVTYMLRGKMEHRDHMDNVGLLQDGDVQWMTAGRGIVHSEMPQQTEGQMRGFQLWLNLAADKKMAAPAYLDIAGANLPVYDFPGLHIIAIAGAAEVQGQLVKGYFERPDTLPLFWDATVLPGGEIRAAISDDFTTLLYVYEGQIVVGDSPVKAQHLVRLDSDGDVAFRNFGEGAAKVLVLAGRPLKEPIVQYGPFVMNSQAEIEQALEDFREGRFVSSE